MLGFATRSEPAAFVDMRSAARDDVFYRTRGTCQRLGTAGLQIVNVSANGFMARSEAEFEPGDVVTVRLPVVGSTRAEIRWALGGRIGCQFEQMIPLGPYLEMLGELVQKAR